LLPPIKLPPMDAIEPTVIATPEPEFPTHDSFNNRDVNTSSLSPDLRIRLHRLKELVNSKRNSTQPILLEGPGSAKLTGETFMLVLKEVVEFDTTLLVRLLEHGPTFSERDLHSILESIGKKLSKNTFRILFRETPGLQDLYTLKLPNSIACSFSRVLEKAITLKLERAKEALWGILEESCHYFGILLASACMRRDEQTVQYIVLHGTGPTSIFQRSALEQIRSVLSWLAESDHNIAAEHLFLLSIRKICSQDLSGWKQQLPFLAEKTHTFMARQCIELMSALKRNICRLGLDYSPDQDNAHELLGDHLTPELRYACVHWTSHLCASSIPLADYGIVDKFLRAHLMHWFEAMSLLRMAGFCEGFLSQLQKSTHVSYSELSGFCITNF
jgi:hypothetical protein